MGRKWCHRPAMINQSQKTATIAIENQTQPKARIDCSISRYRATACLRNGNKCGFKATSEVSVTVTDVYTVHIYVIHNLYLNAWRLKISCLWLRNIMRMVMKENEFSNPADIIHLPWPSNKKQGHQYFKNWVGHVQF